MKNYETGSEDGSYGGYYCKKLAGTSYWSYILFEFSFDIILSFKNYNLFGFHYL